MDKIQLKLKKCHLKRERILISWISDEGDITHISETDEEFEIPQKKIKKEQQSSESELFSDYSANVPASVPQVPQDAQLMEGFMYVTSQDSGKIEPSQYGRKDSSSS